MANPLTAAWAYLRGDDFKTSGRIEQASRAHLQTKFAPSDASVDWQQVQSLILTYGRDTDQFSSRGDGNSAVFSCLMALSLGAIEPPLSVFKKDAKQKFNPLPTHPMQEFLDDPNPDLDMVELRFWSTWAKHVDGNAYLLKVRSGNAVTGNVIELWPISPTRMRPWTEKGSTEFIDYYQYDDRPGHHEQVPKENVIHFRLGIDDLDPRKGLAPIKRLIREIASDAEAMRFADQLLRNFGIPGLVVEVPNDTDLSKDEMTVLKSQISDSFGADNRGNVGVLAGGATMKQFGFSPDQLNLEVLHNVPEARVCSVMGVHPAVAMLGVGLTQTANYASLRAVYEAFTERKLVPLWKMDEAKWNKRLRPDFTADKGIVIMHDLADVRALQEDSDALYARLDMAVKTGWVLPDEARSEVGLPPMPDGLGMEKLKPAVAPLPPGQPQPGQEQDRANGTAPPPAKALEQKGTDLERWDQLMQGLVELAEPAFTEDLDRFADGQKRRVKRSLNTV